MLNTISPQFLQSLQPLQTVPTVKLPAAPRTCHRSIFVVSYNARRSLRAWFPTQRLHNHTWLPCRSLSKDKQKPPPTRRLWRLSCSGQNPKQPPPPSNMLFGERVCGGTTVACSFCNRQVTRVAAGEAHLRLAPARSRKYSKAYLENYQTVPVDKDTVL